MSVLAVLLACMLLMLAVVLVDMLLDSNLLVLPLGRLPKLGC
jgi:hypothetical protein